jgi:hypothetical protein
VKLEIPIWTHDEFLTRAINHNERIDQHLHRRNVDYLPYPITPKETQQLSILVKNMPKSYDVCFCTANNDRRRKIMVQLQEAGLNVINATGWGQGRDEQIASARILINLHYLPDYTIYEHLRCDRWTFAGMLVISEVSQSDPYLDVKDLILTERYDKIVALTLKVVGNYEHYYSNFIAKLHHQEDRLIRHRLRHIKNLTV